MFWKSRFKNWRLFLHHCQLQLKLLSISKLVRYTFLRTLFSPKDAESQRKTDNRVKNVHDMMEEVKLKMEDLERWETLTNESSQSVDYR